MKKNFLISTGGSGGHVMPASILYNHLSKENDVIISTDKRGLKYLDTDVYRFEIINTPKLNNKFFFPLNIIKIFFLTLKSIFLFKRKGIEKIFSTGGYMSLPLVLAARLLKLDIYLLEPNQVLGRANKFFLNLCKKIFCYSDNIKNFPKKYIKKKIVLKPLVKENIYKIKSTLKKEGKFTLLIVGGSQGAAIFDDNLKNSIVNISKKTPIKIIHQTSEKNISNLRDFYSNNNVENKVFSFTKKFDNIMQEVDFCITRAGASTLAELSLMNIPFIAVPLPTSKDNHQFENANFYKNKDCCWIIDQKDFEKKIGEYLSNIIKNKNKYLKIKENLKKLNFQNTWINVNQKILKNLNEN